MRGKAACPREKTQWYAYKLVLSQESKSHLRWGSLFCYLNYFTVLCANQDFTLKRNQSSARCSSPTIHNKGHHFAEYGAGSRVGAGGGGGTSVWRTYIWFSYPGRHKIYTLFQTRRQNMNQNNQNLYPILHQNSKKKKNIPFGAEHTHNSLSINQIPSPIAHALGRNPSSPSWFQFLCFSPTEVNKCEAFHSSVLPPLTWPYSLHLLRGQHPNISYINVMLWSYIREYCASAGVGLDLD